MTSPFAEPGPSTHSVFDARKKDTVGTTYDALANKKRELIRKALKGSVFVAPGDALPIEDLTEATGVAPNAVIGLKALPVDWDDLGWLSSEGAQFAREVASSDVSSWGSNTPTRTDITGDNTSLTVLAQETKLLTLGLATGADLAAITADAATGEVQIKKPLTPVKRAYRVLSVAVDYNPQTGNEIYVARFLPNAEISNYSEQSFGAGDDPIGWGVTLSSKEDSELGYAESWLFGGQGWFELLDDMGIETAP